MAKLYLYGQVLATWSVLLEGAFPKEDGYAEIDKTYFLPGGETGTAAIVLASLGEEVKVAGTHIGVRNKEVLKRYFSRYGIDDSELLEGDFEGAVDYVVIGKETRTAFGEWKKYYSKKERWYEEAREESVKEADVVGIDPYFDESVVKLCRKYKKPYVTIDTRHDSVYAKYAEAVVVSHEYLESQYREEDYSELLHRYFEETEALIIFTLGKNGVIYGRRGSGIYMKRACKVEVESTLGAGDSFKAGVIYGIAKGYSDEETVIYANAIAASACMHFPIAEYPPTLELVETIVKDYKKQ